ncbi:hypothetical protein K2X96_00180 [Patescibacteria group bacterium]|nr:hypothetical protein [Patescibacteria group bacterium]
MEGTITAMPLGNRNPAKYGEMFLEVMTLVSRTYPHMTALQMQIVLRVYAHTRAPSPYHLGILAQHTGISMDSLRSELQNLQRFGLVEIFKDPPAVHRTQTGLGLLRGLMYIAGNHMK